MYQQSSHSLEKFLSLFKNRDYEKALENSLHIENDHSLNGLVEFYKRKCKDNLIGGFVESDVLLNDRELDSIIQNFYKLHRFSISFIDNDVVNICFSNHLNLEKTKTDFRKDVSVNLFEYTILKNKLIKTGLRHFFIEVSNFKFLSINNAFLQSAFDGFIDSPINCIKLSDANFSNNENELNYILSFGKYEKILSDFSNLDQKSAALNKWNESLFKLKEIILKFGVESASESKNKSFGLPVKRFKTTSDLKSKLFENCYVINLTHRKDRRDSCLKTFKQFDVNPKFISAVFGKGSKSCQEISGIIQDKFVKLKDPFKFNYETEFYLKYDTEIQRTTHYFNRNSKIFSVGSAAYMLSYRKALLQAYFDNQHSEFVAIFDDDILLHREHELILDKLCEQLPADFNVLSLGAIQYNWNENINNFFSKNLYQCFGLSIASHATIYRRDIIPLVVKDLERMELPYDVGTLHYLKKVWLDKSYVVFPNLFIQDSSESDIADTQGQLSIGTKKDNVYKWNLDDYFHF